MKFSFAFILGFGLILPFALHAAMSGGDFEIYADSVGFLDSSGSTGGDFTLYGSGEAFQAATSSGGTYALRGGFQAEEKGVLQFSLSDGSISLGSVTTTAVSSVVVTTTISTDSETGYTLYIYDDGNLRSGGNDIDDVVGTVDAGSEEYGFVTNGTDGIISSDTAITTSPNAIASASGEVTDRQVGVEFRASVSPLTVEATYSHSVTLSATVNP
jgi:hypothetical protein